LKDQAMPFTPSRLGPGAIYLRALDAFFRSNGDLIKVAEVEPQMLWTKGTLKDARPAGSPAERSHLSTLPQRILTHGVGYPIGGTVCDQTAHIAEFKRWNRELGVEWTSEHLSILHIPNGEITQSCGFLMPPIQNEAGVNLAVRNIVERRRALGLPFAFETGVNYFSPRDDEIPDGEFFAVTAQEADCGVLLDLTNLWINQQNGRAHILDILSTLPLDRVWELHLAGVEQERGYWVDAHSREIDPEVVALAAEIVPSLPNLGAIVFELAPDRVASFGERAYLHEIETLHRLWNRVSPAGSANDRRAMIVLPPRSLVVTPGQWEQTIAFHLLPEARRSKVDATLSPRRRADEESFALYSHLAGSFRSGALAELLGNTIRLLLLALGKEALQEFIDGYIASTPPSAFPTDEVVQFRRFLEANPPPVSGLNDLLTFEASLVEAAANNTKVEVCVRGDIESLLSDLAAGKLPDPSVDRVPTVLEIDVDPVPSIRVVTNLCLSETSN
jgi:uncharacterized protein